MWTESVLDIDASEKALTVAAPVVFPASSPVEARPSRVRLSWGSTVQNVVENVTTVPFWTGVPLDSVTTAVMTDSPSSGMTGSLATTTIVDAVGASSGRVSQPWINTSDRSANAGCRKEVWVIGRGKGDYQRRH